MTTKICTKCNEEKELEGFCTDRSRKFGKSSTCKVCCCKRVKVWKKNNLEKVRERAKAWRGNNLEKPRERAKAWKKNNPEKARARSREQGRRDAKMLSDTYIIRRIRDSTPSLTRAEIRQMPELIEACREQIRLKRLIKNLSNTTTEHEN